MAKQISGSNPDMNKRAKLMRVQLEDVQGRSDEASRKVRDTYDRLFEARSTSPREFVNENARTVFIERCRSEHMAAVERKESLRTKERMLLERINEIESAL